MKYQSSSQSGSVRTCMMNNDLLRLQGKCFNLPALECWFMSERSSTCRRKAGQPVQAVWVALQGTNCEDSWAIQREKLELLLSVKLSCQLLYHARHHRAQPRHSFSMAEKQCGPQQRVADPVSPSHFTSLHLGEVHASQASLCCIVSACSGWGGCGSGKVEKEHGFSRVFCLLFCYICYLDS